jgi:predicted phage-related endonuclease
MPLPGEGVVFVVEHHDSRAAWLAARTRGIGGSDAAALWGDVIERAGESVRASLFSLYHEKVSPGADSGEDADALEEGEVYEPAIAELYRRRTGRVIQYPGPFVLLRSVRWPWMHMSVDRLILGERPGVLECKLRTGGAEDWRDGLPLPVVCQVQHGLSVTGYGWGSAAVQGRRFMWADIQRSERWIAQHVERCRALWDRVEAHDEPEPDGHEAAGRTLRRLHPHDTGATAALGVAADVALDAWLEAREDTSAAESRKRRAENRLRKMIGHATHATLPSGRSLRLAVERESGARVLRVVNTKSRRK